VTHLVVPKSFERERYDASICPRIRDSSTCTQILWIYVTLWFIYPPILWEREKPLMRLPQNPWLIYLRLDLRDSDESVTQMSPWLRWVRDSSTCPRSLWEREREIYTLPESDTHLIAPESVTHLLAPESFEKETYYWSILAPDSVTHLIAPESVTRLLAPKSSGITWHGPRLRWVRDSSTCPRNLLMQHPPLHWEETTPPAQHNSNMCIHICITC